MLMLLYFELFAIEVRDEGLKLTHVWTTYCTIRLNIYRYSCKYATCLLYFITYVTGRAKFKKIYKSHVSALHKIFLWLPIRKDKRWNANSLMWKEEARTVWLSVTTNHFNLICYNYYPSMYGSGTQLLLS